MDQANPFVSITPELMSDMEDASASPYSYSLEQEKVLFWIGKPTFLIGVLTSFYICYCIAHDQERRKQTFRRLLFCLSVGHILLCLCVALAPIPMPSGSHYASFGSEQSCRVMGFVNHVVFGYTLFYHGAMGFYYIFTFFLKYPESKFQKRVEPILHVSAVAAPLVGAIIGIATDLYGPNELLLQCWVETGAPRRNEFVWLAGLIELNYFTVFKQMSLVGIAFTVYKQERRMVARYSVNGTQGPPPQSVLMTRETLIQASIFFLSCFVPYALKMVMRYMDLYWKNIPADGSVPSPVFGLAAAAEFLYPLQGPFTMTGFLRPDFNRFRKAMGPDASFWECLKETLLYQLGLVAAPRASIATSRKRGSHDLAIVRRELNKSCHTDSVSRSDNTMDETDLQPAIPPVEKFAQEGVASMGSSSEPDRSLLVKHHTLSGIFDLDDDDSDNEDDVVEPVEGIAIDRIDEEAQDVAEQGNSGEEEQVKQEQGSAEVTQDEEKGYIPGCVNDTHL